MSTMSLNEENESRPSTSIGHNAINLPALQLLHFILGPRRNDPYFPGEKSSMRIGALLAELDDILTRFQLNGRQSDVPGYRMLFFS
jgi:hypothetical protein